MKNKSDLSIVNLSTYTSPVVKEVRGKQFIEYGEDNDYFSYLIDRYNGSPTNNAIINGVSEMIYGKGLDATDSNKKPNEYAQMMGLFNKDCTRKLCYDLKLMGQCAIQVIYSKDRSRIVQLEHIPIETLRAEKCNEKGEIEGYFYFSDWSKYKRGNELKRIPAFGTSKEGLEILYIKPYRAGFKYYSPVDYQGGTQYAELEEEISNFHLNNILNGLAPSMLINFNNSTPSPEQREMIERRIYEKFSGSSNAGKFILAFNDSPETAATIEPVQLSDAHQQYEFLSNESSKKIMVAHRVVSPMLFGIKDDTGLGNNADELKTASILFDNLVIKGFQNLLIEGFNQILAYNDISLHLYFKTLQPLEFTDLENVVDSETREEETGVKLSKEDKFRNSVAQELIDLGQDEDELLEEFELIDEGEVNYEFDDEMDELIENANEQINLSTGSAKPYRESEQDGKTEAGRLLGYTFLVRYKYAPERATKRKGVNVSRDFCNEMIKAKKVYRKEDIKSMDQRAVNAGFGKGGAAKYSIWLNKGGTTCCDTEKQQLYKGGARCHHYWSRRTYLRKDGNKSLGKKLYDSEAKRRGFIAPKNAQKVAIKPKDMPYSGYTAAYAKKIGISR